MLIPDLLLPVLVHLAQREEMFNQEHDVDSAESRQPLPHRVQVIQLVLLPMGTVSRCLIQIMMMLVASLGLFGGDWDVHVKLSA